jgi:RHS repeat-associated protein
VAWCPAEVNRLTEAKEGKIVTGSISTCLRDEQWTLSQPGNWSNHKLDKDGNLNFTDSGELNDTGTFSKANDLTARDIDTSGGNNYTLAYDSKFGITDDGQSYKYVWDAFGRLVTVKNQSAAVVAEYRYNGLGFRISMHYDVTNGVGGAPDGTVDGNDPVYYFAYDLQWRPVATYRGSDSNAKERFIYHNAGANGLGGSSYIDLVVLRDRDANTTWYNSADSTAEERNYYCQNWRADVVAITTSGGLPIEFVRYSAYGVPSSFALADLNHDGVINGTGAGTDYAGYFAIQGGSGASSDTNFDGDSGNAADDTDFFDSYNAASAGGIGVLSRSLTTNRIGYAGYQWDPAIGSYHVRHRVYRSDLGRWLSRDPLEQPPTDLYVYCADQPMIATDPQGLIWIHTPCMLGKPPADWETPPGRAPALACAGTTDVSICEACCKAANFRHTYYCFCTYFNDPGALQRCNQRAADWMDGCMNVGCDSIRNPRDWWKPIPER